MTDHIHINRPSQVVAATVPWHITWADPICADLQEQLLMRHIVTTVNDAGAGRPVSYPLVQSLQHWVQTINEEYPHRHHDYAVEVDRLTLHLRLKRMHRPLPCPFHDSWERDGWHYLDEQGKEWS